MNPEQLLEKVKETVIFNLRHTKYEQTVSIANEARKLLTKSTKDQYKDLIKYRIRESEEQKKQRVRLTNTITYSCVAPSIAYAQEIKRADGIKRHVDAEDRNQSAVSAKYARYHKGQSLFDYLFDILLFFQNYDPNAWVIFAQSIEGESVDFYPLTASSTQAIDYRLDFNGNLQYLTTLYEEKETVVIDNQKSEETRYTYLAYCPGGQVECKNIIKGEDSNDFVMMGYELFEANSKVYAIQLFPNTTTTTPAMQAGAYYSESEGANELFFAAAEPYLQDLIRDKSYLDTNKTTQTFPRRKEYVKRCEYQHDEKGMCDNGYLDGIRDKDHECPSCNGSGKMIITSEQDVMHLAWPDNKEELVELSKLSHTEDPNLGLVQFLRSEVEQTRKDIFRAIFNQETVDKTTTVQTATEIKIEYDKIYNKLMPFANIVAKAWELGYEVGFQYLNLAYNSVEMSFPYDFKMKSVSELIDEYGRGKTAGLPYAALHSIERDLISKQYRNSPQMVQNIEAFDKWRPWRDKSMEEIAMILSSRANNDPQKLLWENWNEVINEVKEEQPAFYLMLPSRQKQLLYEKAQTLGEGISYRSQPNALEGIQLEPVEETLFNE